MTDLTNKLEDLAKADPDVTDASLQPVGAPAAPQGVERPTELPPATPEPPAAPPLDLSGSDLVKVRAEGHSFGVEGVEYLVDDDGFAHVPATALAVLAGHGIFPAED